MVFCVITFCLAVIYVNIYAFNWSIVLMWSNYVEKQMHRKSCKRVIGHTIYVAELIVEPTCVDLASGEPWRAAWVKEHELTRF